MADQYVGKLKKEMSKNNAEYFKGFFGKVPVVGFWGKKDPNSINLKIDAGLVKWIDEQEEKTEEKKPVATAEAEEEDDLPF